MRRAIIGTTALVAIALFVGMASSAVAATTIKFGGKSVVGAAVGSHKSLYVAGTLGIPGAVIRTTKPNAAGTGGTDVAIWYLRNGTMKSVERYTQSPPDALGVILIIGSGQFVRGTGRYAHIRGKYTFRGTANARTNQLRVSFFGRETF